MWMRCQRQAKRWQKMVMAKKFLKMRSKSAQRRLLGLSCMRL